uniref:Uncharacterized protein n=1 Tax=Helianthus annuus TaxID=4232 RepID=A0A251T961_HELAN
MDRIRIKKALTDQHKAYRSHIEHFWQNAKFIADPPSIQSFVKVGNEDVEVVITEDLIRRVLDFGDRPEDPTGYPARMVKGCFYRMGYTGHVNETNFSKKLKHEHEKLLLDLKLLMLIRERKRWMLYLKSDPSLKQNLNLNRLISHSLFSLVKLMMCLMRHKKNEERIAAIVKKTSIKRFQFMNKPIL